MSRVFVDTSALLALLDADDPRQPDVVAAFAAHRDDELTHGDAVAESLAVARRRFGVEGTVALLDDVLPPIALLHVDPELHEAARQAYRTAQPSATSFVDRVSLAVIARDGIAAALALDPDLAAPGLTLSPE
ncbi:MAG: PIN domain-containing protein [Chloroflexi bacterium]|nr:PIN domain-containing protein [Chloroflexota bacterium]